MLCTVSVLNHQRFVFDDFNMTNKDKVFAGVNSEFKEIIWLYPKGNSTEPNAYVIYNVAEKTWVYGDSFYNTYHDRNVFDNSITTGNVSATAGQFIWDNEPAGIYTGDGVPLSSFLESSKTDINEGDEIMFIDKIIPDYTLDTGNSIELYVKTNEYPSSPDVIKGPFNVFDSTKKINLRARGRQASVRVSGTNDGAWRWGSVRMAIKPDGGR